MKRQANASLVSPTQCKQCTNRAGMEPNEASIRSSFKLDQMNASMQSVMIICT